MTYLEKLLDGAPVEWKPLGEVCKVIRGERVTKKDLVKDGAYPVVSGGAGYMGFLDRYNREACTITVAQYGTAGILAWQSQRFWANDVCYSILPDNSQLNNKFLYYFLATKQAYIYSRVNREAYPPSLARKVLLEIEIPLPPLAVQQQIVEIFDKFTALIEALETERTLRTRQYAYYRNKLLRFGTTDPNVQWCRLGDIGKVCMCRRIFREQTTPKGDIPFYKIGTFGREADAYISYELYEEYRRRYPFPKIGDVLISASGTIGRLVIYDGAPAYFQDSNIVWINNDESLVLNRFLYYYYGIVSWKTDKGTIERLYNRNLEKIPIPLPPLAVQEQIVAILDKFDTLVHSMSEGLPAEIALRRRQYEYYRNLLLRFPPPVDPHSH